MPGATLTNASGAGAYSSGREVLRASGRQSRASRREIERERARLESNEQRVKGELKRLAGAGRMDEARVLAKNLAQIRSAKQKLFMAETQLGAVQTEMAVANSQGKVMEAVAGAAGIMQRANGMNGAVNAMEIAQNFQMESEKAALTQEMTDDALDSVLGGPDVDEESEAVLQSVLDDIGLQVGTQMGAAPAGRPAVQAGSDKVENTEDLMARIAALEKH